MMVDGERRLTDIEGWCPPQQRPRSGCGFGIGRRMHTIETLKAERLSAGFSRTRVNNLRACFGKMRRTRNHELFVCSPRTRPPEGRLLRSDPSWNPLGPA